MAEQREATPNQKPKLPGAFWLVIIFEFFERGSYYGMMSVLAVYFTDILVFSKENAGLILSIIQPILYFLPIVAGALADRFGYRRALTVAFSLLGAGYFLTSQTTGYSTVFLSLVVMALGAGTFKPIISGTIARTTTEENSSVAFGIYYWTINLGAFLFPLILVPTLKNNLGWNWVFVASAIGTGAMLIPTLLLFREPKPPKQDETSTEPSSDTQTEKPAENQPAQHDTGKDAEEAAEQNAEEEEKKKSGLLQTLANAFEIIYSPIVLLYTGARSGAKHPTIYRTFLFVLIVGLLGLGLHGYLSPYSHQLKVTAMPIQVGSDTLLVEIDRNQTKQKLFEIKTVAEQKTALEKAGQKTDVDPASIRPLLIVYKPRQIKNAQTKLAKALGKVLARSPLSAQQVKRIVSQAEKKIMLEFRLVEEQDSQIRVTWKNERKATIRVRGHAASQKLITAVHQDLSRRRRLAGVSRDNVSEGLSEASHRPFTALFVGVLLLVSLLILYLKTRAAEKKSSLEAVVAVALAVVLLGAVWVLPYLSTVACIVCSFFIITILSLWLMDISKPARYRDHFKFLLMICLYSGFWVLYFQMFGSVLWYVKAYVDATPLNSAINSLLALLSVSSRWHFDIEHVTVINAGTIICLQLIISRLVKKTPALPTMVGGILVGTIGMAILALSAHIWVFMAGIVIFSIGEMTAHPKFISYVGLTAPRERVAMYMGYVFLYGVIGSSIGSYMGAKMYVHFVDHQNQPRVLWLLFAGIGVATIAGLLLYNRFVGKKDEPSKKTAQQA
jgi:dipeptide/tripeptide permease